MSLSTNGQVETLFVPLPNQQTENIDKVTPSQGHFSFFFEQNSPETDQNAFMKPAEASAYAGHLLDRARQDKALGLQRQSEVEAKICDFVRELCRGTEIKNISLTCPHPDGVTLWVDRAEALRQLCFPPDAKHYQTPILDSYRVWSPEGGSSVLHNPVNDKRTTKGVNHVVDYGYPVPNDKYAVPREVFAKMWERALNPPLEHAVIPHTVKGNDIHTGTPGMTKILIHPVVAPAVPGIQNEKRGEIVFVAPGGATIANLDFVSQVFGLAGSPFDLKNDLSWQDDKGTGLTGCIVVAPHLLGIRKIDLGLPHYDQATERQRREGMCWKNESDLYNDGQAFKITARDPQGRVVTLIADNYFGYNKKEVMTELSFECNRVGGSQVKHSGGAEVARCVALGRDYTPSPKIVAAIPTLHETILKYQETMERMPEGYARDRKYPDEIVYVPKTAKFFRDGGKISWEAEVDTEGREVTPAGEIPLRFDVKYTAPNGFTVMLVRETIDGQEHINLVGRSAETVFFHKPCTVSGGGKSELGKTIRALVRSEAFVLLDPEKDLAFAEELCSPEGIKFFKNHRRDDVLDERSILSTSRSLGSVIKLLTPHEEHSDEHNAWLAKNVPSHMRDFICLVKRNLPQDKNVEDLFFVADKNGQLSSCLRERTPGDGSVAVQNQLLRVGWGSEERVRFFGRRPGNAADDKYALLDDITVSSVVPAQSLREIGFDIPSEVTSVEFTHNCERRLFQRPDDAFVPGADLNTEKLFATDSYGFYVNYQALGKEVIQKVVDNAELLKTFHPAMQEAMLSFLKSDESYFACTAYPRMVDGKPTSNPRFLQLRPDHADPAYYHHKEISLRLLRHIGEPDQEHRGAGERNALPRWVNINVPAHRLALADEKTNLPTTAIWGIVHNIQGAAEVAKMICTFTPKSRATTGFGDEGALTKGPFNFMLPVFDINAAVIESILTQTPTFYTAAGFIGPQYEMDHDITYLITGILARLSPKELDAGYQLREGLLQPVPDIEHQGEILSASILGNRITERWVRLFGGRVFVQPETVIPRAMLHPEEQNQDEFGKGLRAIWKAYQVAAQRWKDDGSYELAIPPVKRALDIMLAGYAGPGFKDPSSDKMFSKEALLAPDSYYWDFLKARRDVELTRVLKTLDRQELLFARNNLNSKEVKDLHQARDKTRAHLESLYEKDYISKKLFGTIGTDPGLARVAI